jgi:Rv2258c-like winged HTH domain
VTTKELHQAQVERCVDNMLGMLNNGVLALMTSIGHRPGLFDTMTILPPFTSAQLAAAAGLHERYGRKYLGTMVTAGVVDVDPASARFVLPAEW